MELPTSLQAVETCINGGYIGLWAVETFTNKGYTAPALRLWKVLIDKEYSTYISARLHASTKYPRGC
jgi:hypothetical protein